ncbi:uracil-DNA glycosylase family protein [Peribacillus sp. SI8-4]|uniref:uracil-DNA glycosylase family protein n=1 Tax=Peribacillus sp. SI8-4 TaxID=3048009 RepID=UPI002556FE6E|nr:uracil-DNA glycosylase family protein [Peribacillus sp. SI8-4]
MDKIIDLHCDFYEQINTNSSLMKELEQEGVKILQGFNQNIHLVRRFYDKYYSENNGNRIVLCGINPGLKGAGKTGIPFIDYAAASQLLPNIQGETWEDSSKFIFSVIEEIGVQKFFENVYVTNISWFGFRKGNINFNYHEFPSHLSDMFTACFIEEMRIVKPKVVIPLGKEVEKTLKEMIKNKRLNCNIASRMNHPRWCSIRIDERPQEYKQKYSFTIKSYME